MLAHDRRTDDFDRQGEIGDEAADDLQLLEILLAEDRDIGQRGDQELGDHGRDTLEMRRPETVFESGDGGTGQRDRRRKARRIDFRHRRGEDGIDADGAELFEIGLECPRISVEIFARRELRRIDEDRDDGALGHLLGDIGERDMARMQRAHGRDERDTARRLAPGGDAAAQHGDRSENVRLVHARLVDRIGARRKITRAGKVFSPSRSSHAGTRRRRTPHRPRALGLRGGPFDGDLRPVQAWRRGQVEMPSMP